MEFANAKSRLDTARFKDLRHVSETGSTNADLVEILAGVGPDHPGTVLVADHQSAGRGRLGRTWEAPRGASILCSIGFPTMLPAELRPLVSTAVGLAARAALRTVCGLEVGLKWPNDLVAVGARDDGGDLKLAGVLAESHELPGPGAVVVVGIGINCNWPAMPAELADTATSVNLLTGRAVDRGEVVAELLLELEGRLALLDDGRTAELAAEYGGASATIGRRVRVELPDAELVGTAVEVTPLGELVVEDDQRVRRSVAVGDVVHLRPA